MSPLYSGFSVASSHDKNKAFNLGEQIGRGEKKRIDGDAKQKG
jgi:hypothetical protein